jgi:catechol 2,3-dioxygenase-like lactoylglutathione lyase family enzyme
MNPTAAERKMLTALQRSGVAPETAALSLERAREAGVPLGLVDVGGEATLRLGRSTRTLPGEGSTIMERALEERAAGQSGRIIRQLEEATGQATTGNSGQTVDALLEQARTTSRPFYRALRQFPAVDTPEMQSIFSTPAVQNIMREHERALAMGGRRVNPMYGDDGRMLRAPTLLDIDMVKQIDPDWTAPTGYRMGLAFLCDSVADVDARFANVIAAGFEARKQPWDAFWGQRYAQVLDPDGNIVDLFAPLPSE